jgi:uncharacterized phage protein (TIGR02218 family)
MKAASPSLIALLNGGADFQMVDLWTITLVGGAVIRWSGGDVPIVSGGHVYALGPLIERQDISEKIGLDVTTVDMAITASPDDLINGVPIIPFIRGHGFDGANVRLDRAFLTDWGLPVVGTVLRFSGRVTAISAITGDGATITVSSWTVLLNANMPANLYQAACLHAVYDAGCALNPAAFAVTGTVGASPTPTLTMFDTSLTPPANDFAQGRIVFTSGPNTGISATVMANDGAGLFQLVSPLPTVPVAGNTFTAYPGCDLTQSRCSLRFNNLGRFKATPYVPVPETAFG